MKILEVIEDTSPNFDLVDDASFYMRNDPEFYRKEYFPAMSSIADMHSRGKKLNPRKSLGDMVDKGCTSYCTKYNLAKHPEEVFSQEHRDALVDKLFGEEMEHIKKGEYK